MVSFSCDRCDFSKNIPDKYSSKSVVCPKCKTQGWVSAVHPVLAESKSANMKPHQNVSTEKLRQLRPKPSNGILRIALGCIASAAFVSLCWGVVFWITTNNKQSESPLAANSRLAQTSQSVAENKLENERLENERLENERLENERLENERLENVKRQHELFLIQVDYTNDVVKDLTKLESLIEIGVTYDEYRTILLNEKPEIDARLDRMESSEVKTRLSNSLSAYVDAIKYWRKVIDKSRLDKKDEQLYSKYDVGIFAAGNQALKPGVKMIWINARKERTLAENDLKLIIKLEKLNLEYIPSPAQTEGDD